MRTDEYPGKKGRKRRPELFPLNYKKDSNFIKIFSFKIKSIANAKKEQLLQYTPL